MDALHLATLAALVDAGTFDAAAGRLHITPSAVSQRVKAMEQATGTVLVLRTTPIQLTDAGVVVLRHARQVDLLEADTARALRDLRSSGDRFRMPLAVNADSLATWFLPAIAGVGDAHRLAFDLHREDQEHTTSLLRSGVVMASVTSTREPVQGCITESLGTMRYQAVCSPAFRDRWLGDKPRRSVLRSAPVVHFDRNDDLQEAFLRRHTGRGNRATALRSRFGRLRPGRLPRVRMGHPAGAAVPRGARRWRAGLSRPRRAGRRAALLATLEPVVTFARGGLGRRPRGSRDRPPSELASRCRNPQ